MFRKLFLEEMEERSEHVSWLMYEASLLELSNILTKNEISLTKYLVKKFNLKLRNVALNFPWAFNSLVLLSYPIIDGKNEYFFNHKMNAVSTEPDFSQGTHYCIAFGPFSRFLKEFFGFKNLELEMIRNLICEVGFGVKVKGKSPENAKEMVFSYDRFLTLLRFVFLKPEGRIFD